MTLQALMLHIIVVIYVCRKLHWFRPDLSDLVLGVFSSPVRFVIIELDLYIIGRFCLFVCHEK